MVKSSTPTAETIILGALGAILSLGLSAIIANWLSKQFEFLPPQSLLTLGVGLVALLLLGGAFVGVLVGVAHVSEWRSSLASCPHKVLGGQTRKRCPLCVREQEAAEEDLRHQVKRERRRQEIAAAAAHLRNTERKRLAKSLVPSMDELRELTWQQFEDQIASMFERMGYNVEQTPYVKDHGRDAILWKNGGKFLLECKRYADGAVSGRRDLQILHSNIVTDRAVAGFFVTAGGFTKDAVEFACTHCIELIDRTQLARLMLESKAASVDESYRSMCRQCGDVVWHQLRVPRLERCRVGHDVEPTLDRSTVLATAGAAPSCECGAPMRVVHWNKQRFWGCTRYPRCRQTRRFHPMGR